MSTLDLETLAYAIAHREFEYCLDNDLALWLTYEQALELLRIDGRIDTQPDANPGLVALLIVEVYRELVQRHEKAAAAASRQELIDTVDRAIEQHLGDDWNPEAHEALYADFIPLIEQALNQDKKEGTNP